MSIKETVNQENIYEADFDKVKTKRELAVNGSLLLYTRFDLPHIYFTYTVLLNVIPEQLDSLVIPVFPNVCFFAGHFLHDL